MPEIYTFYDKIPLWLSDLLPEKLAIHKVRNKIEILDKKITKNSILICGGGEEEFVSCCERKNIDYGIISIGDEANKNFMGYATSNNCKFIVRDYLHPHLLKVLEKFNMTQKILHIQVGFSNEFFEASKALERPLIPTYKWSFAGELKPGRVEALETFNNLDNGKVVFTDQGFKPDEQKQNALTSTEYFMLMAKSLFIPCPLGWVNIDTQRIYECLEAGAIPVVLRNASPENSSVSYWRVKFQSLQPFPFVESGTWNDALSECKYIIETGRAQQVQKSCQDFWKSLKQHWKSSIGKLIFESFT